MKFASIKHLYKIFLSNRFISIDSRNINPNQCLFFAIKGKNADGNQFADIAINKGAEFAIVDDQNIQYEHIDKIIYVPNVLETLKQLAIMHRDAIKVPVIGITGTSGKTTTKNLIKHILNTEYEVAATQGNLNSNIGLPLSILQIQEKCNIVVLEMGADKSGDIRAKCDIAKPTHGIITNIGKAHMETFGSLENIKKTKAELYDYLQETKGIAFVNSSDKTLLQLAIKLDNKIFYGKQTLEKNFVTGTANITNNTIQILWNSNDSYNKSNKVNTNLTGEYNLDNCLAAIAVSKHFKISNSNIKKALSTYQPSDNRSEVIHTNKKNTIINDSYNANPLSMSYALKSFSQIKAKEKIAIIGDMLELGIYAQKEHERIITLANNLDIDKIFFVGEEFYKHNLTKTKLANGKFIKSKQDIVRHINNIVNSHILLKASRSMHLEDIISYL